jgi:tetratricopeptide (TPR) repeat protein
LVVCCDSHQSDPDEGARKAMNSDVREPKAFNENEFRELFKSREYVRIIEILEGYDSGRKEFPEYWNILGSAYLAVRKIDNAETCFRKAIDLNGGINSHFNLGEALFLKCDFDGSRNEFTHVFNSADASEDLRSISFFKMYLIQLLDHDNPVKGFIEMPDNVSDLSVFYCYVAYSIFILGDLHQDLQNIRSNMDEFDSRKLYEDAIMEALEARKLTDK